MCGPTIDCGRMFAVARGQPHDVNYRVQRSTGRQRVPRKGAGRRWVSGPPCSRFFLVLSPLCAPANRSGTTLQPRQDQGDICHPYLVRLKLAPNVCLLCRHGTCGGRCCEFPAGAADAIGTTFIPLHSASHPARTELGAFLREYSRAMRPELTSRWRLPKFQSATTRPVQF